MDECLPSKWKTIKSRGCNPSLCKTDAKTTKIKKDKEGHYIMIKGSMQQELTILNTYAPNREAAPRFIKQVLRDCKET